jgi:hypothetical protein
VCEIRHGWKANATEEGRYGEGEGEEEGGCTFEEVVCGDIAAGHGQDFTHVLLLVEAHGNVDQVARRAGLARAWNEEGRAKSKRHVFS